MQTQTSESRRASGITFVVAVTALVSLNGCKADSPTAPQVFDPPGTYQSPLYEIGGPGSGGVSVTPRAIPDGYFTADIKVRLLGAKPNTMYTVQRAPEVGRPLGSDGICQRALNIAPWSPSDPQAPVFLTFTQPGATTPVTLMSSATGAASVDFTFSVPTVPAGTQFDVMFRVIDDLAAPRNFFLSGCFTVTVL
jgi:hypothetical protein